MDKLRLNTKLISSLNSVLFIPAAEIIVRTGIAGSTWYRIVQTPVIISIQQLLAIANGLSIPVRRFFSFGRADVIGKRDDYVSDPYTPCYYDDAALQKLVDERPDATWKKAAKAAGMSYSRLRNSLLGETRTPVTRFITVCEAFEVDPFTILKDPNPEPKTRAGRNAAPAQEGTDAFRAEVNGLREDIRSLSGTVEELAAKYESLLEAYETLAHRISVNIDTVNGSYIGITAETSSEKK